MCQSHMSDMASFCVDFITRPCQTNVTDIMKGMNNPMSIVIVFESQFYFCDLLVFPT